MLRARAAFTLRHVRTPWFGGVRRLCSVGASSNLNTGDYFYSETEAREKFEIWCNKYGKTYPSEEEKQFRFDRFRQTLEWCTRENQKIDHPEQGYFGTYEHADQTENEYLRRGGGWRPLFPMLERPGYTDDEDVDDYDDDDEDEDEDEDED